MFCACRLAKEGYFGGDPAQVLKAPVNIVLAALQYESFQSDYQTQYDALNNKGA